MPRTIREADYRHGLRASELCDLQWSQVELATGRLHVRRAKNGSPSVHPMQGVSSWGKAEMLRTAPIRRS
jgi:type 1 fimbriae regulatory protein FimB/type 1 fimbriae regulatory protein FimE